MENKFAAAVASGTKKVACYEAQKALFAGTENTCRCM